MHGGTFEKVEGLQRKWLFPLPDSYSFILLLIGLARSIKCPAKQGLLELLFLACL